MDDIQSLIEELRFGAENGADAELLERAADKIQELVADLGDADAMTEYWMKKNKWIKCSERLPYDDQMVLIPIITKEIPCTEILICRFIKCERPMFRHYGFRGIKDFTEVTHWMPLPDAPEVDG